MDSRVKFRFVGSSGRCAQPLEGEWPERSGRPRVLIENPDGAELWAHAETLREAGYDVAVCKGESEGHVCPLLASGSCALVDGTDVVVSSSDLPKSHSILALLEAHPTAVVVFEGSRSELDREFDLADGDVALEQPVTARRLVAAAAEAFEEREARHARV